MTSTVLAGSTGLVGSHILSTLLAHPSISSVQAYTRRDLPNPTSSPKLTSLHATETSKWASMFPKNPPPQIFFSGLGTTRGAAGGVENQRKIDLDLNLELAEAAKEAGCSTYVLISSASPNSNSSMAYPKMKGELEDAVRGLGFRHTVIVRPGLIMGSRSESRPAEAVVRHIAGGLARLSSALVDGWGQEAEVIGRAAVKAGLECAEGKREEGVSILSGADIVRLGRTEWAKN